MNIRRIFATIFLALVLLAPLPLVSAHDGAQSGDRPQQMHSPAPTASAADQPQPALPKMTATARAKVEPLLLKQIMEQGQATFIIRLKEQPDLAPAMRMTDLMERRRAVFHTLRATAERSQRDVLAFLRQQAKKGLASNITPLWIINGIAVTGDGQTLAALAEREDVQEIRANHPHQLPDLNLEEMPEPAPKAIGWNIDRIGANRAWEELGITGEGVVVANMDTGVDWQHNALQPRYRGANGVHDYNWFDFTDTYPSAPNDGHGHGTHTMGTIVGDGTTQKGERLRIGVAPGARWIAVKVFGDDGATDDITLHKGFQWLLAPTDLKGENPDPTKAPDAVNHSWGADNGADPTFRADIQALRAAGIFQAFASGNNGELGAGTVGTPASFPEAFAVGASNTEDLLSSFSSQGPSFWLETKPEVTAPGEFVRSSLPNNAFGVSSGTSMATPHAVGTAALIIQASRQTIEQATGQPAPVINGQPLQPIAPMLDVADIEQFMGSTAFDLGAPGPDNEFGAGRLDAFRATRWALTAGKLSGYVRDAHTSEPVPFATIVGTRQGTSEDRFTTTSDAGGEYAIGAPGGLYRITVTAFGYQTKTVAAIEIFTGFISLQDITLTRAPAGTVVGQVRTSDDQPIMATIEVVGTPVKTQTDRKGTYRLDLPAGEYTLKVMAAGYKGVSTEVAIIVGRQTAHTFVLEPAPAILLLDADQWVGDNITNYYRWALEEAGYVFDTRAITTTEIVPTVEELAAYDVVIWVHGWASPGEIDRRRESDDNATVNALTAYLDRGGRVLLSGQDIGFLDGGGNPNASALAYYADYLHAGFEQDTVSSPRLSGVMDDILSGVELEIGATLAYKPNKQLPPSPDVISPLDPVATTIMTYEQGEGAALKVQTDKYRLIYFASGLARTGPRPELAEAIRRSIKWLSQPTLGKTVSAQSVMPGEQVTYSLTLHNPMGVPLHDVRIVDPLPTGIEFVLDTLTGGAVYNRERRIIEWTGGVMPRDTLTITFQADVGEQLPGDTVITNTVTAEVPGGILEASVPITVLGPNLSPSRKTVDRDLAVSGDEVAYSLALVNSAPVTATNASLVDPIPAGTTYVVGSVTGGASFDSETNAIRWSGAVPAAVPVEAPYTWVDSDTEGGPTFHWDDRAETMGQSVPGMGDDTTTPDPIPIGFEFPFFNQAFTGFHVSSNGFLSFTGTEAPFTNRRLPDPEAPRNLIAPFWDDLSLVNRGTIYTWSNNVDMLIVSWVDVGRFNAPDATYTFQAILHADGSILLQYKEMQDRLDSATIGIQNSAGTDGLQIAFNEDYVHNELAVLIEPPAPPVPPPLITFAVTVDEGVTPGTVITNVATLDDGHGVVRTLAASTLINVADMSQSTLTAPAIILPGGRLTYTLTLSNTGQIAGTVTLIDPIPTNTTFVEDSLTGGATYDAAANAVRWTGDVPPNTMHIIEFAVDVDPNLPSGTVISNTATLEDAIRRPLALSGETKVLLPDLSRSSKRADRRVARSGEVLTYTIRIENNSPLLAPDVSLRDELPAEVSYVDGSVTGDATFDATAHAIRWSGQVPARGEGYVWDDSDMLAGPGFAWDDRAEVLGVRVRDVASLGDDDNVGPFSIGFEFSFYDDTFTEFWLDTNGYLVLTPVRSAYSNLELPDANAPGNLLAVFWDDLDMRDQGEAYYWTNNVDTLVVSWVNVRRLGAPASSYTFQAILHDDGTVIYQYQQMLGERLNEATIGIQNADGSEGLTVVHNQDYVHDELAVRIAPPTGKHVITFQARLKPDIPLESVLVNVAEIQDSLGQYLEREISTRVNTLDLSGATMTASATEVSPGERLTYTFRIPNRGTADAIDATVKNPLPSYVTYVEGSVTGGAVFDGASGTIHWSGTIEAGDVVTFSYAVDVVAPLPDQTVITNQATISDGIHPEVTRSVDTMVVAPDLSPSAKEAATVIGQNEILIYRIRIINVGHSTARVTFRDPLPGGVEYLPDSGQAGSGSPIIFDADERVVRWTGLVPPRGIVQLRFAVRITQPLEVIDNVATVDDGIGSTLNLEAHTRVVPHRFYIPFITRRAP